MRKAHEFIVVASILLAVGWIGVRDRLKVAGKNFVSKIDAWLGEDKVRLETVNRQIEDLKRARDAQLFTKFTAQVRAETLEKTCAMDSAVPWRDLERRAGMLLARLDSSIVECTRQYQEARVKHRLLQGMRDHAAIASHHSTEMSESAGSLRDGLNELLIHLESQIRTEAARADVAVGVLPK